MEENAKRFLDMLEERQIILFVTKRGATSWNKVVGTKDGLVWDFTKDIADKTSVRLRGRVRAYSIVSFDIVSVIAKYVLNIINSDNVEIPQNLSKLCELGDVTYKVNSYVAHHVSFIFAE